MAEVNYTKLPLNILILDDEMTIRTTLSVGIDAMGHRVAAFGTVQQALDAAEHHVYDMMFLDVRLGVENGLDFIPRFLQQSPWMKIVVITAYSSIDTAVEAMRRGALDYLPKPFTASHVEALVNKVAEARAKELKLQELTHTLHSSQPPVLLASENLAVRASIETAKRLAGGRSPILVQGEGGTGRRTLARAIHGWSARAEAAFGVCSTRGKGELRLGAELFGLGDAPKNDIARLEQSAGGTLYIDELTALTPRLQQKLLDLIQKGSFERDESRRRVEIDVRIIAGTRSSLSPLVESGLIFPELYDLLAANTVELPPLRDRLEDLPALTDIFISFYSRQNGEQPRPVKNEARDYLAAYSWPGNIRELRNIVERAVLLARSSPAQHPIGIEHLPPNLLAKVQGARVGDMVPIEAVEEAHIRAILDATDSLESASKILGIDYATLWRRRKKYGI